VGIEALMLPIESIHEGVMESATYIVKVKPGISALVIYGQTP
jgi:hypothetical protein